MQKSQTSQHLQIGNKEQQAQRSLSKTQATKPALNPRASQLISRAKNIETPYNEGRFLRNLSLTARQAISAVIVVAATALAVTLTSEKSVQAPLPTDQEVRAALSESINFDRVSTMDLLPYRFRMLPDGENSVLPRDEIINRIDPKDRNRASVHNDKLGELLTIYRSFDNYVSKHAVDTTDAIAVVAAAASFDADYRKPLSNNQFVGDLTPEAVVDLFSRLEQIGENEIVDRELIDYHESYDQFFAPKP